MHCQEAQQLYDAYAQGSLPPKGSARLEEHLARCPACHRQFEEVEHLGRALRESCQVAYPGADYFEGLTSRVLEKLAEPDEDVAAALDAEDAPRRRWGCFAGPMGWSGAMAAAMLLVLALAGGPRRSSLGPAAQFASLATLPGGAMTPLVAAGANVMPKLVQRAALASDALTHSPSNLPSSATEAVPSVAAAPGPSSEPPSGGPSDDALSGSEAGASTASRPSGGAASVSSVAQAGAGMGARQVASGVTSQEIAEQLAMIRRQVAQESRGAASPAASSGPAGAITVAAGPQKDSQEIVARQSGLFARALEDLRQDQPRQAWSDFTRLIELDATTVLARRAALKLADLNYDAWADFAEAKKYYEQSQATGTGPALSPDEAKHVTQRLHRLRSHAANQWEALSLEHEILHGEWPEALAALDRLLAMPNVEDLISPVARSVADRLQTKPGPPIQVVKDAYKLLENGAQADRKNIVRAWLELAMGDLQVDPFQDQQAALYHYRRAVEAAPAATVGHLAAAKRDQLMDRHLLELTR